MFGSLVIFYDKVVEPTFHVEELLEESSLCLPLLIPLCLYLQNKPIQVNKRTAYKQETVKQ